MTYSKLRRIWETNPLKAGAEIYSRIPEETCPKWAGDILSTCCEQMSLIPAEVQHIIDIALVESEWSQAHNAFSEVRKLTLKSEARNDTDALHYLLYVAENACKVIYNSSFPMDSFDTDSGAWLVRCSREFAEHIHCNEFTDALWAVIANHEFT